MAEGSERRRCVRAPLRLRAQLEAGGRAWDVTVCNLGPDGAFALFAQGEAVAVSFEQPVRLRFTLDSFPLAVEPEAVVRWCRHEAGRAGCGVQFLSLGSYERSAIADYCERVLRASRRRSTPGD